jgi:hypothetical protein
LNTIILPGPGLLNGHAAELTRLHRGETGARSSGLGVGNAVFLHTGWRSGGTWIWSRCRDVPRVHGYYEPLHEQAAKFRRRDVARMRPGSWQSNHSQTAPYFEEYRDLIPTGGRGVPLYQDRFAFDDFFRPPDAPGDPELIAYLRGLLSGPIANGRVPVLKFCRSLGRVGWFEQQFPQALHAVVLRDPVSQFSSCRRLMIEERNRYFALAPLLVLARNVQNPLVREAALALGVSLPILHSDDIDYAVETCWRHIRRLAPAERYRGFLAFWTLSALSALESDALVIDIGAMRHDAGHRQIVENTLGAQIGEPIELIPRGGQPGRDAPVAGRAEAHRAAIALLLTQRARLSPQRLDLILEKLELAGALAGFTAPTWKTPKIGVPATQHPFHTWLQVRLAHAMQPLRRLHGALVRRWASRK